jgi:GAF domain-containing protein
VASHDDLAAVLAAVADKLAAEPDLLGLLQRVCELAVETIDGCEHADVMVFVAGETLTVPAASDWVGARVVSIEAELDEGPCLEASRTAAVVPIDDLTADRRWPRFAARCLAETPVRSSVGFPLTAGERTFGAMDLYASQPRAFETQDVATGVLFAVHAAVAISAAKRREALKAALASRDVIGQAKGILMAQERVSSDAAFDMLRHASQTMNIKLRAVAERIVDDATRR